MAKKKQKVRVDRVIILILIGIILLGLLSLGAYKLISYIADKSSNSTDTNNNNNNLPVDVDTTESVKLTLVDYDVYYDDTDKLGFNFVLAKVKFEANEPVSFDLGNLRTSQKVYLNDIGTYTKKLEDNAYNLSKLEYTTMISADENSIVRNLFIPFKDTDDTLTVYNGLDATRLEFDLNKNIKYFTSLKLSNDEEIIIEADDTSVSVKVSKSYISSMMLHNGEEYDASAYNVYTFDINVMAVDGNVMITDAKFIKADNNDEIGCLSKDYSSVKAENIIGKKLSLGENGALFFEVPAHMEVDYAGQLLILFSNSNQWVTISTELD